MTKLRGSDFRSGRHAYRLSEDGITVFPRLADPIRDDDYRLSEERISSGIAPLDRMLAEGYAPGSSTLVAGPSGAGKTLMGLHFIFSGAANGEPGVIATLQENPIQLQRVARGFGWSLDDERVAVMHRSPNDVYIDEWVYELLDLVETTGATRVMIDSLSDLQYATPDPRALPRVHLLAHAAPLARGHQPDHDQRDTGPLPRRPPRRVRDLAPLRQRRPAAVPARRSHASCARSRSSSHARAPTTPRSASSTSPPTGSSSETRSPASASRSVGS